MELLGSAMVRKLEHRASGPPQIGYYYDHPEDELIKVTGGQYQGEFGISNHWSWIRCSDGAKGNGYWDSKWIRVDVEEHTRIEVLKYHD